jgi:hypothetical protein
VDYLLHFVQKSDKVLFTLFEVSQLRLIPLRPGPQNVVAAGVSWC